VKKEGERGEGHGAELQSYIQCFYRQWTITEVEMLGTYGMHDRAPCIAHYHMGEFVIRLQRILCFVQIPAPPIRAEERDNLIGSGQ
jgi:hypothetical protein